MLCNHFTISFHTGTNLLQRICWTSSWGELRVHIESLHARSGCFRGFAIKFKPSIPSSDLPQMRPLDSPPVCVSTAAFWSHRTAQWKSVSTMNHYGSVKNQTFEGENDHSSPELIISSALQKQQCPCPSIEFRAGSVDQAESVWETGSSHDGDISWCRAGEGTQKKSRNCSLC